LVIKTVGRPDRTSSTPSLTQLGSCAPRADASSCSQHSLIWYWSRTLISWQCIMDRQQACLAVIENQTIRLCHFGAHRVAAEDHPWIKDRELTDGPVEFSTLDG
jgi:hypothetical protein